MDIDRNALLKRFDSPDCKLSFAKVYGRAYLCYKDNEPSFSDFLPPSDVRDFVNALAPFLEYIDIESYGGYDGAERLMIGFFPKGGNNHDYPIDSVVMSFDKRYGSPGHRDVLGALMGLGIDRRTVGDIVAGDGVFAVICASHVASYIAENMTKAGRVTLKCRILSGVSVTQSGAPNRIRITAASPRLDSVLAKAFNLSRSEAAGLVKRERVQLNFRTVTSLSIQLSPKDIITARGLGRVAVAEITGETKRGRIGIILDIFN